MTEQPTDPFGGESNPSLSFRDKPIGTSYTGTVVDAPKLVQSRNFDTGKPDFWPDGNPKMAAVTVIEINGDKFGVWASKPSALFAAIKDAQTAAGAQITVGGTLQITYVGDKPNENPAKHPAKQYQAVYTPPNPFGQEAQTNAWGQPAAQKPAATPAPPAAQQSTAAPPAAQVAPAAPPAHDVQTQIESLLAASLDPRNFIAGVQLSPEQLARIPA